MQSCLCVDKQQVNYWWLRHRGKAYNLGMETDAIVEASSSGWIQLYAALNTVAEALGLLSIVNSCGWHVQGEVRGDVHAALGIIGRNGLGIQGTSVLASCGTVNCNSSTPPICEDCSRSGPG